MYNHDAIYKQFNWWKTFLYSNYTYQYSIKKKKKALNLKLVWNSQATSISYNLAVYT